jgi:hypothetical protein
MAETEFTRKQIKEFPLEEFPADLTVLCAPVARFAKYLLMGNGP